MDFELYIVIGVCAGTLAGLLGLGGGVIIVPALVAVFMHTQLIPPEQVMRFAVATSLAIVIVTFLSSLLAHLKQGSIRWDYVQRLVPGLLLGVVLGSVLSRYVAGVYLHWGFALFLLMMAYYVVTDAREKATPQTLPANWQMICVATTIGILTSLLGVGGGIVLVPFLLRCGLDIRMASATTVACGVLLGLSSALSYILFSAGAANVPMSSGYVYWPAFIGVASASVICAPLGTLLAYRLPAWLIKRILAVFLLLAATEMILT